MKKSGIILNALAMNLMAISIMIGSTWLMGFVFPMILGGAFCFQCVADDDEEEIYLLTDRVRRLETAVRELRKKDEE